MAVHGAAATHSRTQWGFGEPWRPEERAREEGGASMAKSKRLTAEELKAKYPHMVEGSLEWDELHQKQKCRATCADCGAEFEVFTSDLFQLHRCKPCRAEARKARRRKGTGRVTIDPTKLASLTEEQRAALVALGIKLPETKPAEEKSEIAEGEAVEAVADAPAEIEG
ncbi:MAG: hypothetical protein DRH24_14125 [Deltaproteobacteria bacterium]|nr:MAG: hypothetical protein DRH24_14125 [Deltaproteobacteria bacterium]